jgi:ribose transport system ATP-binding protein
MNEKTILEVRNMYKSFNVIQALKNVDFDLREGEIHVLCGENGAGKSTLMKILAGNYKANSGTVSIEGKQVEITSPLDAEHFGIAIVYQETSLSPTIAVYENMYLGRELNQRFGLLNKKLMITEAQKYLKIAGAHADPKALVSMLSVAEMQLVQIAKALSLNARIIIMDEPCSALSEKDSDNLFRILKNLKSQGISIIYIDHRMENIFKIGDRITVLRDGEKIGTRNIKDITQDEIIQMMVGRSIHNIYPKTNVFTDRVILTMDGFSNKRIHNVHLKVRAGEILGIGGLVGAGRSEIMRALFCLDEVKKGAVITLDSKEIEIKTPLDAIKHGIGYVPEDRKLQSLFLLKSVQFNSSIVCLDDYSRGMFVDSKLEKSAVSKYVDSLNIKAKTIAALVNELSGGNQQKVVLAKWLLMKNIKVLLLDEPTRGVDVGAKYEIYKLINQLSDQGIAIVMITSELPELIGLCDRIAVVRNGEISGVLDRCNFSQVNVMKLAV